MYTLKQIRTILRRCIPYELRNLSAQKISLERLRVDFSALPKLNGRIIFIHSSLKSLGYIEGGARGVVSALIDHVLSQNGTLAMPAFSMRGSMAASLRSSDWLFDARTTPSMMGAITEAFRQHLGVRRSLHPTHSICAIGPLSQWLTIDHHKDARAFGKMSPFGKLLEANGIYAGLGVSIRPFTFAHAVEDHMRDFPISVYTPDSPLKCQLKDQAGQLLDVRCNALDSSAYDIRIDAPQAQALRDLWHRVFVQEAGLQTHPVGDGQMWVFPEVKKCYETMVRQARDNNFTIYTPEESSVFKSMMQQYQK